MRGLFIVGLLVAGIGFVARPGTAQAQQAASTIPCVMEASAVNRSLAVFTVGPADCNVPLGPVSMSAYDLPGGSAKPWAEQQLHAHSPSNGRFYGPGTYELWVSIDGVCNWQTDLYRGTGQDFAPHIHFIEGAGVGWDTSEGNTCDPVDGGTPIPVSSTDVLPAPPASPRIVPSPANAGHGVFDPAPLVGAFSLDPAPSTFTGEVTVRSRASLSEPGSWVWPVPAGAGLAALVVAAGAGSLAYIRRRRTTQG